ncbi:MAG: hypothetical protein EBT02_15655, partial [Planctomycetia bacterium]|nr:hypothetical protein [Planctomycetia bacterium]
YKDSANNFGSGATLTPVISVDTLRPLAPVVVLASDTGISATDKVTYAGIVTVSGIEANATWEFSNDNGANWSTGPNNFTFAFINDGAKSLFIRQTDAAGNLGPVNHFSFTLDTVAPAIPNIALNTDTGISALDKITKDGKIIVTGLESTARFEYALNSDTSWTPGSGNSFTLTGDGAKLVRVRQIDLAGNIGAATADLQFTLDTTSTTLAVSSSSSKLKAGETATITFTFSETAYNFDYSDITVVGGVLSNLTQNLSNKKLVTATFTPLVNSITTGQISVVANYNDAAGNSGTSAVLVPIIAIDTDVPTVGITSGASALKIGETTVITFSLSEPTSDFTLTDVTVTGGTLSNFAGSNNSYTATFTPAIGSTTTASINVAAGKFADAFANQNLASNALKISVDTSAPVATFAQVATPRNTSVSSLDVTFTESVSGFDVSDLSLTFNGNVVSLSNVSISGSGANYTISGLNTTAQGAYVLALNFNASGISDAAGNALGANASVSWSVDTSSPAVAITSSTNKLNPGQNATITFTFSTAPSGFDVSDITAVGGAISGLTKSSNTVYTATLTPAANFSGNGSVAVSNGYTNSAGTTGLPGLSETIAVDTVAPTAVISSSVDRLGVGQTSTITFTFSEAVAGFDS